MKRARPKTGALLQCPVCYHVFSTATTLQTHVEQCLLQHSTSNPSWVSSSSSSTDEYHLYCSSCNDRIKDHHYKCSICEDLYFCRSCDAMGRSEQSESRVNHTSKHHIITVGWNKYSSSSTSSACSSTSSLSDISVPPSRSTRSTTHVHSSWP